MKKSLITMQNADRFVHAIFCDDIRHEVGNKVSFMGCYQGELFVPFMPLVLPKLCVQVTISTTKERPIKSLTVRLDQGGNPLASFDVTSDDLLRSIPPALDDAARLSANVAVMLSPFSITEPGELRVVVVTEEGEMTGPRLHIKVTPQADAASLVKPATRKHVAKSAAAPSARAKPSKKVRGNAM